MYQRLKASSYYSIIYFLIWEHISLSPTSHALYALHVCNIAIYKAYNMVVTVGICSVLRVVVKCVLFYIISLPFFLSIQKFKITWSHSLKGQYYWSFCWSKEKVRHWWRFMFPLLSARTILSQTHINTVRKLQVRIYCVLLSYVWAHPRFTSLPILQACSMYFWAVSLLREFYIEPRWRSF